MVRKPSESILTVCTLIYKLIYTSTPLQSKGKHCTFYSATLVWQLPFRLKFRLCGGGGLGEEWMFGLLHRNIQKHGCSGEQSRDASLVSVCGACWDTSQAERILSGLDHIDQSSGPAGAPVTQPFSSNSSAGGGRWGYLCHICSQTAPRQGSHRWHVRFWLLSGRKSFEYDYLTRALLSLTL